MRTPADHAASHTAPPRATELETPGRLLRWLDRILPPMGAFSALALMAAAMELPHTTAVAAMGSDSSAPARQAAAARAPAMAREGQQQLAAGTH
jgi:hypothetical protein